MANEFLMQAMRSLFFSQFICVCVFATDCIHRQNIRCKDKHYSLELILAPNLLWMISEWKWERFTLRYSLSVFFKFSTSSPFATVPLINKEKLFIFFFYFISFAWTFSANDSFFSVCMHHCGNAWISYFTGFFSLHLIMCLGFELLPSLFVCRHIENAFFSVDTLFAFYLYSFSLTVNKSEWIIKKNRETVKPMNLWLWNEMNRKCLSLCACCRIYTIST